MAQETNTPTTGAEASTVRSVGEVMQQQGYQQTKTSTPEPWDRMQLTEQEATEALNRAKREKYEIQEKRQKEVDREVYHESLRQPWTPEELFSYITWRSKEVMKMDLVVDERNQSFIQALCLYFTNDPLFEQLKDKAGNPLNWKLNKGLLIQGSVGVGKTFLMKLFSSNKRACFDVINCRKLAAEFSRQGDEAIEIFSKVRQEPKDARYFFQQQIGTCFDDLGTEDEKQHFGNKANVMADIILNRYERRHLYSWEKTHITTNLNITEMTDFYGERVIDRMKEMFNRIKLTGDSRRA